MIRVTEITKSGDCCQTVGCTAWGSTKHMSVGGAGVCLAVFDNMICIGGSSGTEALNTEVWAAQRQTGVTHGALTFSLHFCCHQPFCRHQQRSVFQVMFPDVDGRGGVYGAFKNNFYFTTWGVSSHFEVCLVCQRLLKHSPPCNRLLILLNPTTSFSLNRSSSWLPSSCVWGFSIWILLEITFYSPHLLQQYKILKW